MDATEDTNTSKQYSLFHKILRESKHVAILSGAGLSAESGVPTFRGPGGYWRRFVATQLATPEAFKENPSRVWQFYHYRRNGMLTKQPNPAHKALSKYRRLVDSKQAGETTTFTVITQNVDELTPRDVDPIEMHGSLFRIRCTACGRREQNRDNPICEALRGTEDIEKEEANIPIEKLPSCSGCGGLMRPDVVWFHENLDEDIMKRISDVLRECDLFLVVGTSAIVYPAAGFAERVKMKGGKVVEFNIEATMDEEDVDMRFVGPCGQTLPKALRVDGME
ncbi:hypothetical protein BC938DRAFT_479096 [Jimgerdemannia flammicorona]|uniref:NAD-dependent protein deacylase n=1 Tax=Jimgerdemannia flammicorona TaxID=994334 RepID=A0A433QLL7_9FUNG|nr:hypothetical protein BC938DRAFT_479096 [Jimgerdemannia flammicorona]